MASSTVLEVDFDGFRASTSVELKPVFRVLDEVSAALSAGPARMVVSEAAARDPAGPMLLDVREDTLFAIPWEELRWRPPLMGRSIIRTAPGDATRAVLPVDLSADLLIGSLGGDPTIVDPVSPGALPYFRVTRFSPPTVDVLTKICTGAVFDTMHFQGVGVWPDGERTMRPDFGPPLDHASLARLKVGSATRLLVLVAAGPEPGALLDGGSE